MDDPPAEKIPRVDQLLEMEDSSAVSKVLGDDDLLRKIIVRVAFPTTLLRAALVCKRWLGNVSDPAFLRRFRDRNDPPMLLGFYTGKKLPNGCVTPQFVPILPQPPQDPVLADLLRRMASFSFNAYDWYMGIKDVGNGCVLFSGKPTYQVHRPMGPDRGVVVLPMPPQPEDIDYIITSCFFTRKDKEGLSFFWFSMEVEDWFEGYSAARVYKLQNGVWRKYIKARTQLPRPKECSPPMLVHDKIYMAGADMKSFLVFDLSTRRICNIQLPEGVECGGTVLSPADGSGLYLIHVSQELQLRIWLCRDNWSLVDTIPLLEMILRVPDFPFKENNCYVPHIKLVGDSAEFVFLEIDQCGLLLDIKSRTLRKVYQGTIGYLPSRCPFMMIWPPKFPALKDDSARSSSDN